MSKISLAEHMKEHRAAQELTPENCGPYVTISRQFGCYGFSLGLLLLEILNEQSEGPIWKIYHKEILSRLATETNLASELLEEQRRTKPSMISNFFRSFSRERIPSGYEIRNKITALIRGLAIEGYAIIIGQGGAGATQDLPNGISIRLESPEDWRVKQIAFREGLNETEAKLRIRTEEQEREYLRKIYQQRFTRKPAFNLTYDCSVFTLAQIAQHIVYMMRIKGCIQ
jgi:hypothetical protein